MTLEEKFSKIVDNLIDKTEKGQIRWEPSTKDSFVTSRTDSSVAIERGGGLDSDGVESRLVLYDSLGYRAQTIHESDLSNGRERLNKLFRLAKNAALNVEALADAWLV